VPRFPFSSLVVVIFQTLKKPFPQFKQKVKLIKTKQKTQNKTTKFKHNIYN